MIFTNSTPDDLDLIFNLFEEAIAYQKTKFKKCWQGFERTLIEKEIKEKRHWKILVDGELACFFSVTYEDPLIWGSRSQDPAMYLHRIVTNPYFRGRGFMQHIMQWALQRGKEQSLQFIRMDTWGDNEKLINYYVACVFSFIGLQHLQASAGLPKHYEGIHLSLFQLPVNP